MASEPVYVTRMEIENVRCFAEQQELDLTTPDGEPAMWSTILGENGTGKTTLLKMLALGATFELTEEFTPELPPIELSKLRSVPWLATTVRSAHVPIRRTRLVHDERRPASVSVRAIGDRPRFHQVLSFVAWDRHGSTTSSVGDFPMEGVPPVFAYGASRNASSTSLGDAPLSATALDSLLTGGATLLNAEEWLLRLYLDRLMDPGGPAARQYEAVRKALIDVLPDVTDIPEPRKPEGARAGNLKGRIRFVTPDGDVGFDDLSLGYQTMTAWVVDLAARLFDHYPDSKNPLAEPAIVLVDEIDLHLHPRWQRDLIRWLRSHFPKTQFVVTAHSPLVVQASEDANVVVLRRTADKTSVVIDNDPGIVRGWRVDQLLTSGLYGLESARSPDVEEKLERRRALVTKAKRTKKEEKELAGLDAWAASLPTAERSEDQATLDALREAAALLVSDHGDR